LQKSPLIACPSSLGNKEVLRSCKMSNMAAAALYQVFGYKKTTQFIIDDNTINIDFRTYPVKKYNGTP
jgi:hypothetical protein